MIRFLLATGSFYVLGSPFASVINVDFEVHEYALPLFLVKGHFLYCPGFTYTILDGMSAVLVLPWL